MIIHNLKFCVLWVFEFLLWGSKQIFFFFKFFYQARGSFEPLNVELPLGGIFQKQDNEQSNPT